jgi:apolipoprotein N-acyltransferase
MKHRTADQERRLGIRLMIISGAVLVATLALWWLVESTNREGEHDAQLLPFFTLIPLVLGLFHLLRARSRTAEN